MSPLFDYHSLAERLRVPADRLEALERSVRAQYGCDDMMFELRMVRTLRAVEDGATTLEEAMVEYDPRSVQPPARQG